VYWRCQVKLFPYTVKKSKVDVNEKETSMSTMSAVVSSSSNGVNSASAVSMTSSVNSSNRTEEEQLELAEAQLEVGISEPVRLQTEDDLETYSQSLDVFNRASVLKISV
jgi:hypothetical protein